MHHDCSPIKYCISGGFGGICIVIAGHPLDTLKIRLQTMLVPKPGEKPMYTSTWDCFYKTVKLEGFFGLYKGVSVPMVIITPTFATSFLGYGMGKRLFQTDNKPITKPQLSAAGSFSGLFTTFVVAPGERIKCLLQVQVGGKEPPKYSGMIDCAKQLYQRGGIFNIYRGIIPTFMRDVPAFGLYFMSYEWLKEVLIKEHSSAQEVAWSTMFSGGMAGVIYWLMAMPADVLKSRLQCTPEGRYSGLSHVFRQMLEKEGPKAFYKGLTPVMIRAFPANAACFAGFEIAMKFLKWAAPNL